MPNVSAVGGEAAEDDIPLLNAAGPDDQPEAASAGDDFEDAEEDIEEVERSACSDCSSPRRWEEEEPEGEERFPKDDGRCYDDPLWFGKSLGEIRLSTDRAKVMGNEASRAGDWKAANRCWKDSLRGAEKLKDVELELRLRLNLALGYVRRGKPERALEHCDEIFRARLKSAASAELRAKAHFRRGEAYEAAGEESKAAASFTAALDVEPGNAEVRRKLAALKKLEAARQGREREFFRGKLAGAGPADPADAARTGAPPAAAEARPPAGAPACSARGGGRAERQSSAPPGTASSSSSSSPSGISSSPSSMLPQPTPLRSGSLPCLAGHGQPFDSNSCWLPSPSSSLCHVSISQKRSARAKERWTGGLAFLPQVVSGSCSPRTLHGSPPASRRAPRTCCKPSRMASSLLFSPSGSRNFAKAVAHTPLRSASVHFL
mmetsp:Transcript_36349/g.73267  ORF Transcript_36349/g.73267 Transcript_36349/m.73267 type:complete len:434 (+) Transcript_36349:90-1391(+)